MDNDQNVFPPYKNGSLLRHWQSKPVHPPARVYFSMRSTYICKQINDIHLADAFIRSSIQGRFEPAASVVFSLTNSQVQHSYFFPKLSLSIVHHKHLYCIWHTHTHTQTNTHLSANASWKTPSNWIDTPLEIFRPWGLTWEIMLSWKVDTNRRLVALTGTVAIQAVGGYV